MAEWEKKVWGRRKLLVKHNCVEVYLLDLSLSNGKSVCCSMHKHQMKYNKFDVLEGRVGIETEEASMILGPGHTTTIPPHNKHRFTVLSPAKVIESTWADAITEDIDRDDEGHVLED